LLTILLPDWQISYTPHSDNIRILII